MFWQIILTILAIFLLRELYVYIRLIHYNKQPRSIGGYVPGVVQLFQIVQAVTKGDIFKPARDLYDGDKIKDFDISARNHYAKNIVVVNLNSERAIKDFYRQELTHTKKVAPFDFKFLGFFFSNGKEGLNNRGRFSKLFLIDNIKRLLPNIRTAVQNHMDKLKKELNGEEKLIDIKNDIFVPMFEDVSTRILLGKDNKHVEKIKGETIVAVVKKMFKEYVDYTLNPINFLTFGLAEKLGLMKQIGRIKDMQKDLKALIFKLYKERANEMKEIDPNSTNVLDIMINYNRTHPKEEEMDIEEIATNFEIFQFAASDTSFQVSTGCLSFLAEYRDKQNTLYEEIKNNGRLSSDKYEFDDIINADYLTGAFKETLRITPPAAVTSERVVTKDMKVADAIIKKGDYVMVFLLGLGMDGRFFKEKMEFEPRRFMKQRDFSKYPEIPKMQQLPFSHGQRNCIGQVLGEIMVKIIVVEFLKNFELNIENGWKPKFGMDPIYGVTNAKFLVKQRRAEKN